MEKRNKKVVEKYKNLPINQKINFKSWMGDYKRIFTFNDLNSNYYVAPAILTFCGMNTSKWESNGFKSGQRMDGVTDSSIHSLGR